MPSYANVCSVFRPPLFIFVRKMDIKMIIEIKEIEFDSPEYKDEVELRDKILREPLGLNFTAEQLKSEENEHHLGAYLSGKLVGCLLLKPVDCKTIKMRQVAVDGTYQAKGIGKKLVEYSERLALEKNFDKIILNARDTAVKFYLKLGYRIEGEMFIEVEIPHYRMSKKLF